ncbi:MAG: CehA/McbA family metallohydrolase [Candidatus Marinimicrobia bacterium]|jgi:hypothetical protein|nr:CehA/McbA family metallohydrolase [Candidatus Neomarinimicrobiota bacterium]
MFISNTISSFWSLFLIIGYLEIHYRLKYFPFSRYFKREPEIYADAPHRIGSGQDLPISLIVKDANKYPITLKNVHIKIVNENDVTLEIDYKYNKKLNELWFEEIYYIDHTKLSGNLKIWCKILFDRKDKKRTVINHNVKTSEVFPLITQVDKDPLPGSEFFLWGDLHYHSNYTEDFIEFGAPLKSTKSAATALGLDFIAITDHSYDLDDKYGSWNESDPGLKKWNDSRHEIVNLNKSDSTLLIPGEEISTRNKNGKIVHTLMLNNPNYIHGSGDSGEKPLKKYSEHTVEEVINMHTNDSLVLAAHPFYKFPKPHQILLNRGCWSEDDCNNPNLTGLQILNGDIQHILNQQLNTWIKLLLSGNKIYIYAGNDAHGNFNRYHQANVPMLFTKQYDSYVLGKCRTGLINNCDLNVDDIVINLKAGKCIITNGPAIKTIINDKYSYGDTIRTSSLIIIFEFFSSKLYGFLREAIIYKGIFGASSEEIIDTNYWNKNSIYQLVNREIKWGNDSGYIRIELKTDKEKYCLTNPIWIEPTI